MRMGDFYRTIGPVALASVCSFGVLLFRSFQSLLRVRGLGSPSALSSSSRQLGNPCSIAAGSPGAGSEANNYSPGSKANAVSSKVRVAQK